MAGRRIYSQLLFANHLRFQPTNNAEQQNKQLSFVSLFDSGTGQTEHRIPPHCQCFNVGGKRSATPKVIGKMNRKRLSLITVGLSFIEIVPKILKNPFVDWQILTLYFLYIRFCFLSFYVSNKLLWTSLY